MAKKVLIKSLCISLLVIAALLLSLSLSALASEMRCLNIQVVLVRLNAANNHQVVCDGAADALDFLATYDLKPRRQITIEVVSEQINSNGYLAYGSYDRTRDMITLMSYQAILLGTLNPQMYRQPFDSQHYRGAIAHEVAHAVFHHNSSNVKDQLTNATQEYLAHATQLAVLTETRRAEIISGSDIGPWESGDSISEIYMGLDPTGFAIKSYLHLTTTKNPHEFINIILNHNWFFVSVP